MLAASRLSTAEQPEAAWAVTPAIPFVTPASHRHQIMRVLFLVISHQVIRKPPEFVLSPGRAHVAVGQRPANGIIVSNFRNLE